MLAKVLLELGCKQSSLDPCAIDYWRNAAIGAWGSHGMDDLLVHLTDVMERLRARRWLAEANNVDITGCSRKIALSGMPSLAEEAQKATPEPHHGRRGRELAERS